MTETVQQGLLVLADISGYTAFLARVELDHSHDILADLLGLVTDGLCPPLALAKLEGDAVDSPDARRQRPRPALDRHLEPSENRRKCGVSFVAGRVRVLTAVRSSHA